MQLVSSSLWLGAKQRLSNAWVWLTLLYAIVFAVSITLALAANSQGVLTKEEASSSFVNPTFLEFRLQHHVFSTNFYGYAYFWLTSHLVRGLFYGRTAKVAIIASLPCFLYLYLRKGFALGAFQASLAALGVTLLPGILCFSWMGIDTGMEVPIGCCALWLALYDSTAAILASSFLAAISAETYGAGLAFLAAVAASQGWRLRSPSRRAAVLAGFGVMAAALVFPALWWTNVQTLWTGGAGGPQFHGLGQRLAQLAGELGIRGDSYYFFSNGAPAMGSPWIALLGLAGLASSVLRDKRGTWPLLLICGTSVILYGLAGSVTGVRRAQPLVLALGIFGWLLLWTVWTSRSRLLRCGASLAMLLWMAVVSYEWFTVRQGLLFSRIALPHDFDFHVPAGYTMAGTVSGLLNSSLRLPQDLAGYEPDRTLCMLYLLGKPAPLYSPQEIISRCDRHGWSIPSNAPRFLRFRKAVSKRLRR